MSFYLQRLMSPFDPVSVHPDLLFDSAVLHLDDLKHIIKYGF